VIIRPAGRLGKRSIAAVGSSGACF